MEQDICASRHRNNYESQEAFQGTRSSREHQQEQIIECLLINPDGMTEEEISHTVGIRRHSCSARIAELKSLGAVIRKPLFPGSRVLEDSRR